MPKPIANFETYATKKLTDTGTELFIFDVVDDAGNSLDGKAVWVTIDDGTSKTERAFGTVDAGNKKITLTLRGVDPNDSTVEVAALKFNHDASASVKITDAHYLLQVTEMLSGDIDLQGVPKLPSARTISNARDLVDKEYSDAQSVASFSDFATVDAGGLNVNVNAGTLVTATGTIDFAGVSGQAMADNSTNYLELDENGNFVSNTTGWTEGNVPLSKVVTASGDITSISLTRGLITAPITDNTITDDYTYGATIAVNDLLYLDTADAKWKLADASAASTCTGQLGFALEAGVDTDTGKRVQLAGVVTGLSGLTPGWQFVSDTAGDISNTAGTYKKMVGYAPNATTLIMVPSFSVAEISGGNSALTVANLNEAATFFDNTDITGAEAETLTSGAGSDATELHGHIKKLLIGAQRGAGTITIPANTIDTDDIVRITFWAKNSVSDGGFTLDFGTTSNLVQVAATNPNRTSYYEIFIEQTSSGNQSYTIAYVDGTSGDRISTGTMTEDETANIDVVLAAGTNAEVANFTVDILTS